MGHLQYFRVKQLEAAAVVFPAARAEEMEKETNDADFAAWLVTEGWPEEPTPGAVSDECHFNGVITSHRSVLTM